MRRDAVINGKKSNWSLWDDVSEGREQKRRHDKKMVRRARRRNGQREAKEV